MTDLAPKENVLTNVGRGARIEVAAEVAALATCVVTNGEIDGATLRSLMVQFGLCASGTYDPEVHGDMGEDFLPGDPILLYSADAHEMFAIGRAHLCSINEKLN